jgi:hypothetical protein
MLEDRGGGRITEAGFPERETTEGIGGDGVCGVRA